MNHSHALTLAMKLRLQHVATVLACGIGLTGTVTTAVMAQQVSREDEDIPDAPPLNPAFLRAVEEFGRRPNHGSPDSNSSVRRTPTIHDRQIIKARLVNPTAARPSPADSKHPSRIQPVANRPRPVPPAQLSLSAIQQAEAAILAQLETPEPVSLADSIVRVPEPDSSGAEPHTQQPAPTENTEQESPLIPLPRDIAERAWEAVNEPLPNASPADLPLLGTQWLPISTFGIEFARPQQHTRLRLDSVYGINRPDRAEYWWSKIGSRGPKQPEEQLNFQSFSFYRETGNDTVSGFMKVPVVSLDPAVNQNTTGFGLIEIGTKTLLFEEDDFYWIPTQNPYDQFRITMLMRTYLSVAPVLAGRGLTNGHLSLEPGLLTSYDWSKRTMFHGEFKFWVPMGGTRHFAGNIVKTGIGVSHILYSGPVDSPTCDSRSLIGTLELQNWNFLHGQETLPSGTVVDFDGRNTASLNTGLRLAINERLDFGLNLSWNLTRHRMYESLLGFEIRLLN